MKNMKQELEKRAVVLGERLHQEEQLRAQYRAEGRQALDRADVLLQSVEMSLASADSASLTARGGRSVPLPPIDVSRPKSANE